MGLFPLGLISQGGGAGGGSTFVATLSSANAQSGFALNTNTAGDIILAGLSNTGSNDAGYFARIDALGTSITFQRATSGGSQTQLYALTTDGTNFFAVGFNSPQSYLLKFDGTGSVSLNRSITVATNAVVLYGVALDSSGNIFIGGRSWDTSQGINGQSIAKLDSSGAVQWTHGTNTGITSTGFAVAVDSTGAAYVGGQGGNFLSAFLLKVSNVGNNIYSRGFWISGVTNNDIIYGLTIDTSDNVIMTGKTSSGQFFTLKLNSAGTTIAWQRFLNTTPLQHECNAVTDATGDVYVATTDHIVKYNSSGTIQWQRKLSRTSGTVNIRGIKLSGTSIVVTGFTDTTSNDIIIGKFPNDGTGTGTYVVGSSSFVYAAGTLTDSAGTLTNNLSGGGQNVSGYNSAAGSLTIVTPTLALARS
jgi:hypothetical protein